MQIYLGSKSHDSELAKREILEGGPDLIGLFIYLFIYSFIYKCILGGFSIFRFSSLILLLIP